MSDDHVRSKSAPPMSASAGKIVEYSTGMLSGLPAVEDWARIIGLVVLVMAAFPSLSSAILRGKQSNAPVAVADENSAVLKVKIPSMDCAACALNIQSGLKKQAGVQQAQVSFDTKEAVVRYDATKLSPEKIIAVIDKTGFKSEPTTTNKKEQ